MNSNRGGPSIGGKRVLAGMSLLELTIVLAVIALLAALAVPTYQRQVVRAQRSGAIELLLAAASCQERIYVSHFHYDTRLCAPADESDRYELHYEPADTLGSTVFTITAEPQGAQVKDYCGSLSLDQNGNRSISGPAQRTRRCWEGR